jgi:hypothetical protein
MQNQSIPKQIATPTMEAKRRRGRPRKRWRDEVEEGLNIMGIKNREAMATGHLEWWKIVLEAKVHNGVERLKRIRRSCTLHCRNNNFQEVGQKM